MREGLSITDGACFFSLLVIIAVQDNTPETTLFSPQAFIIPNGMFGVCSDLLVSQNLWFFLDV